MARKIAWRDLASLTRLKNQKLVLDNTYQFVYNPGLFSSSLLSIISPTGGFYTAVESFDSGTPPLLLGQFFQPAGNHTARVVFLAPGGLDPQPAYSRMFSHLATAAGERGAVQIKAEVTEKTI